MIQERSFSSTCLIRRSGSRRIRVNLAQTLRRQSTNRKYYLQWYRGGSRRRLWKLEGNEGIDRKLSNIQEEKDEE